MRVKLVVAYEEPVYGGWRVQPNGITVEEVLDRELSRLLKEEITVTGASRTDSGVHSLGNVAVFDTDTRMPAEKISYAINQRLPEDIVVQDSCEVPEDFHPRFAASQKTYEYKILNRKFPMPTLRRDTLFYCHPLDEGRMRQGAQFLVGTHDFTSFSSVKARTNTFVRTVYELTVERTEDDIIHIRITGNGFLYNMVRIIAWTWLLVGRGKLEPVNVGPILAAKDRGAAGPTAPAHGLTMIGITYL